MINTQHPQPDKEIYEKPIANITLNSERLDVSPKIRNKTKMFILTTSIQRLQEGLAREIRQENEMKGTKTGKKYNYVHR